LIGKSISHFRISAKLGAGGMGEVYRAQDLRLQRDVAIKVLPPGALGDEAARKRFRNEALALSNLSHPNIAVVYDFDTEDGVDFLVMEHIPGAPLSQKLHSQALSSQEIAPLALQIAAALEEAHEHGVIHRDLKPGNVMVTPKGLVKVLDFGLAKLLEPAAAPDRTVTITDANAIPGTLPYMAPEQLRSDPVDARTDIYALGVVLYEMATGKLPFSERTQMRLADAILHKPPPPLKGMNPQALAELEPIVLKCLAKDPQDRYQSAAEFSRDLQGLTVTGVAQTAATRRIGRRYLLGIGILTIAAACATVIIARRPSRPAGHRIETVIALPSRVFASEQDRFLTDAIPNTLSTDLAQVGGLDTKVPPTSIEMERVGGDLKRIADLYGVSAFVLSSVTAQADRLTLNVQLVDARSRSMLWSKEYDGPRGAYIELARQASEGLRAAIRPEAAPVTQASPFSAQSEAELSFQRGLHYSNRYNNQHRVEDFDLARASLQHALELDPRLARAAAEMAWLFEFRVESGARPGEMVPQMESWARKAVEIDPASVRGWAALSVLEELRPRPDVRKSLAYALRSAALGPRDTWAHNTMFSALFQYSGILAITAARESWRLDPLYLYPAINVAGTLGGLGRAEEALPLVEEVLRLEPGMPLAVAHKALFLIELGRTQEAAEIVKQVEALVAQGRLQSGFHFLRDGLTLDTPASLDRMVNWARDPSLSTDYLGVHRWLIQHGRIRDLVEILDRRTREGSIPYDYLRLAPWLEALRGEPRFQPILKRAHRQFEDMLAVLDEARARGEIPAYMEKPLADLRQQMQ
jgi:TolB-like protein